VKILNALFLFHPVTVGRNGIFIKSLQLSVFGTLIDLKLAECSTVAVHLVTSS